MQKFIRSLAPVFFLAIVALALPARAQDDFDEVIKSFDSRITLNLDTTMQVRETIKVIAAGVNIRHGIFRDFPTRYRDKFGRKYSVGFDIVSVTRDGHPESYHTEGMSNGVRVYFGDSSVLVRPGPHTYVFTYNTSRQLGFFPDHDELYWNVNGLGWKFRTERVTATVVLPIQIRYAVADVTAYTGAEGERGRDYTAGKDVNDNPVFKAGPFDPHEGLSIAVKWHKGLLQEPTAEQKRQWFIDDNKALLAGLGGLALVLIYYMFAWIAVGRDPKAGTIVPLYEPPDNMSPAAMRYLKHMKFDDKAFTAAVIDLASRGYATIARGEDREYSITRKADGPGIEGKLPPDEKAIVGKLFEDGNTLAFRQSNHSVISSATKALKLNLKAAIKNVYFLNNTAYIVPGIILTVLTFGALVLMDAVVQGPVVMFMLVWLSGWTVGVTLLLKQVFAGWKTVAAEGILRGSIGTIPTTLFALPFVFFEIVGLGVLFWSAGATVFTIIVVALGANALFHHLLKAPTRAGRRLLDRVDGFEMFLRAVDGDRLNTMTPPNKTPELFERFLPYALALGIEHRWAEQFAGVLAAAGQAGKEYSPSWFTGAGVGAFSASSFASSFGSSFSSAVSSSSSAPGSSSGFSSGGSSGGGGGGGGGGGW